MIFKKPIPFKEAVAMQKAKKILPTSAGSAELEQLEARVRERAFFSARTTNAGYLAKMDRMITRMVSPIATSAAGQDIVDPGTFRLAMRAELDRLGYQPEKPGGLQDLGSDARLNLIVDMQLKSAHGYGQHLKSNDPDIIDAFPCRELLREESRKKEREWRRQRWIAAGGKLYGGGRMIARKDDPIWTAISRFGTPYPPFDYNSGMGVEEVDRAEAEALGVIKPSTVVQRDDRSFNKEVEASMPKGISNGLAKTLQKVFTVVGDKLILEGIQ